MEGKPSGVFGLKNVLVTSGLVVSAIDVADLKSTHSSTPRPRPAAIHDDIVLVSLEG